ncbi:GNAT family N-acetyltransferase [Agrococcus beijingensis]|uniref:GNAT family N-acetyltransferase n=1 Tax=Agrococcus beijingensis TaxID=3068634 RepID=UPI002742836A|nr:GNAT family N-acetyltransferase [Agrococcus sp. REN33]
MNAPHLQRALLDGYVVDTDPARLDVERIHTWLSTDAYWALGRHVDVVRRAIAGSVSFGVYAADGAQVGYARLVTDGATFGWLCDVYIDRSARGLGLGSALARAIVDAVRPLQLKRLMLATADAHEIYLQAGFVLHPNPEQVMVLAAEQA